MIALGHYSRQAKGGRKLMEQPLVHPQRLGSLVEVSSCLLVRNEKGLAIHSQSFAYCWCLLGWACKNGLVRLG